MSKVSNRQCAAPLGTLLTAALVAALAACQAPPPPEPQAPVEAPAPATGSAFDPPRTPDGRPDLQGIWQALNTAVWNIQDHSASKGVPAGQGVVVGNEIPYLPSALAQREANYANRLTDDPEASCHMVGVPRVTYMPYPFQIVQTPEQIVMLYEYVHTIRNVHMNSEHPPEGIQWWMGDSRGTWEGDTLVVDVDHFTDQTWFDRSGNYHSPALHVVERYTMTGPDHILYEATIEDPNVFSEPWTISMPLYRRKESNAQLLEYECYAYDYFENPPTAGRD
jgi:hypothetical protein